MISKKNVILILASAILLLASCAAPKNIAYFQNKIVDHPEKIDKHAGIVIQPKDMLSIVVSSRNPELVVMFNLPVVSYQAGSEIISSGYQKLIGYVVDNEGYIDFPVLIPTAAIMLIMNAGSIMSVGFEKTYLMQNSTNLIASEVISTYVYKTGMSRGTTQFSYASAIGLFNSLVNCFMLVIFNTLSNKLSRGSLGLF